MKIIDLLNKIANGEIPKTIVYDERYFTYDDKRQNYFAYDDSEIDWKYTVMEYINDEIEIIQEKEKIEEEKKIPEKIGVINYVEDTATALIHNKVDEIIDYLKSKGEQ